MASGSFSSNTGTALNVVVSWSSVANASSNCSTVTLSVSLVHRSLYVASRPSQPYSIDGVAYSYDAPSVSQSSEALSYSPLFTSSVNVWHNSYGSKSVYISVDYSFRGTYSGKYINTITAAQTISLDEIDRTPPTLSDVSVSNVTTSSAKISYTTTSTIDLKQYSLNGGAWATLPSDNIITGLNVNTAYSVRLRIRKTSNHVFATSDGMVFATTQILVSDIDFPQQSYEVFENESLLMEPEITPSNASDKSLNYLSTDSGVAYAIGNRLYGIKKGNVTFTSTANDGGGATAELQIKVKRHVTGIRVSSASIQVETGSTYQLNFSILPDDADNIAVTFETSNPNVAVVNTDGVLTGNSVGVCTVTIVTDDGGYSTTVNVSVSGETPWIDISGIPEPFNYWDVNNIYSNQVYIWIYLDAYCYFPEMLNFISCDGTEWLTDIADVYQMIENNFSIFNSCGAISSHYIAPINISDNEPDISAITRWLNMLNDLKYIADTAIYGVSMLSDNNNMVLCDSNSKKLIIRSDYNG